MANEIHGEVFLVSAMLNSLNDNPNITNYYERHQVEVRGDIVSTTNPNELYAQVWCSSDESNDWQSYGIENIRSFPEWIPVEMLMGLREGDNFELVFNNHVFRLTCNQKGHKYSRMGSFQSALKYLIARYNEREY